MSKRVIRGSTVILPSRFDARDNNTVAWSNLILLSAEHWVRLKSLMVIS